MLPVLGLSGSAIGSFKTKADALHFAIVFTATSIEGGNELHLDKAKTLFEFITTSVELPDVDYSQAQVDELFSATNGILKGIALGLKKNEGDTPEETPEPCDSPDGPPARPEAELSQDRFTFDPRITPVGV